VSFALGELVGADVGADTLVRGEARHFVACEFEVFELHDRAHRRRIGALFVGETRANLWCPQAHSERHGERDTVGETVDGEGLPVGETVRETQWKRR
jgi:hypothetical protein